MSDLPGRPWRLCYDALLPWALKDSALMRESARVHVIEALRLARGQLDLTARATDQDAHDVIATALAYDAGWRTSILSPVLESLGYSPVTTGATGWPLPAGNLDWRGRGRAFLPTLGALIDFFVQNPLSFDLKRITAVHHAIGMGKAINPTGKWEDLTASLDRLCTTAWDEEVNQGGRNGWDDAEWWDYLDLAEKVAWLVVGLGISEKVDPAKCVELTEQTAEICSPESWTWKGKTLPPGFLKNLTDKLINQIETS